MFLGGVMVSVFSVVVREGCSLEVGYQLFSFLYLGTDVPQRWDDNCFLCGGGGGMFLSGWMTAVFCVVVGMVNRMFPVCHTGH